MNKGFEILLAGSVLAGLSLSRDDVARNWSTSSEANKIELGNKSN